MRGPTLTTLSARLESFNVTKRASRLTSFRPHWLQVWGPALVAAVIGAVPGIIALANQAPATQVSIVQPQGYVNADPKLPKGALDFVARVVNNSDHALVLDHGTCAGRGFSADMTPIAAHPPHQASVPPSLSSDQR